MGEMQIGLRLWGRLDLSQNDCVDPPRDDAAEISREKMNAGDGASIQPASIETSLGKISAFFLYAMDLRAFLLDRLVGSTPR